MARAIKSISIWFLMAVRDRSGTVPPEVTRDVVD